jgi:hypothetical protein
MRPRTFDNKRGVRSAAAVSTRIKARNSRPDRYLISGFGPHGVPYCMPKQPAPELDTLSTPELIKIVLELRREIERLKNENQTLRSELEQQKRKNARQAAPFSKNTIKTNPKPSGRKKGEGEFTFKTAPAPSDITEISTAGMKCANYSNKMLSRCKKFSLPVYFLPLRATAPLHLTRSSAARNARALVIARPVHRSSP